MLFALLLLVAGAAAVAIDVHVTNHGVLAAVGLLAAVVGLAWVVWLSLPAVVAIVVIALVAGASLKFGYALIWGWLRLVRSRARGQFFDATATVRRALRPDGLVSVDGAYWKAVCPTAEVPVGAKVLVLERRGLTLVVCPVDVHEQALLQAPER